jgi:hypothetical protein
VKPQPKVTIDGRGVVVHLTDSNGRGVEVPLTEVPAAVARAAAALKSSEGRSTFLRGVGRLLASLAEPKGDNANGSDNGGKRDR